MKQKLIKILPKVQKPARYTGGEYNEVIKNKVKVSLRVALCFPDTYEIGMSNLGMRILYGVMNQVPHIWCQRVFAPWVDMEKEMRAENLLLWALESGDPVSEFDVVAFSVGYEMAYTNILNMLDLAGLPLKSADRPPLLPLVIAGGTSCLNPEPLSDFIDLFVIGEGEEVTLELLALLEKAREEGWSKDGFLRKAAAIDGIYVPSLYRVDYHQDGRVKEITAGEGARPVVTKRIVQDFQNSYYPASSIVPSTEIIHDRVTLEVFRGCTRGCRFCQAGFSYRPARFRSASRLVEQGTQALSNSGYQEISLSSLSTSDYPHLKELCDGLLDWCEPRNINLSLPSLRADNFTMDIMKRAQAVRKSGLTFAPEAGTQRLRDVINKNLTREEILESCRVAFSGGYSSVKLYFMLGLPTETDEDVLAIAQLANQVFACWKQHAANKSRGARITVSTSCFVPKPHTPFQWEPQVSQQEYLRKVALLRGQIKNKAISYNWHDAETSFIEAVLARGDRRLGQVLQKVWQSGGKMDSWSECFSLERWHSAFSKTGLDPDFYALRARELGELLPWSVISTGVSEDYLKRERKRAFEPSVTPDCREGCWGCGADGLLEEGGGCYG